MVKNGDLGRIRMVMAEFAHGFHAAAADADNPRLRWRYDQDQAGVSSVLADTGVEMVRAVHAAARSAAGDGMWVDI